MTNMPERDITGHCEGEDERQEKIAESGFKSPDSFPNAPVRNLVTTNPVGWAGMYKGGT